MVKVKGRKTRGIHSVEVVVDDDVYSRNFSTLAHVVGEVSYWQGMISKGYDVRSALILQGFKIVN